MQGSGRSRKLTLAVVNVLQRNSRLERIVPFRDIADDAVSSVDDELIGFSADILTRRK